MVVTTRVVATALNAGAINLEASMLAYGVVLGLFLVLIGAITYIVAPRVGPNPIFGVRVGYSYASREVWDKTNRFGGVMLGAVGLLVSGLACVLYVGNVGTGDAMTILTVVMLAALLGATGWMFLYARALAQATSLARQLPPAKFRWVYVVPVLVTFLALVFMALYVYAALPVDHVASHFGWSGQADGWSTRGEFLVTFLGMAAFLVLGDLAVVAVATREPLISFGRWGSSWELDPERGLIYTGVAVAASNLILIGVLWDVFWFNVHGAHLVSPSLFLWFIVPLIALLVLAFFVLGRRTSPRAQ